MKLYTYDPAPNPRRLGLFMQYKGISLDTRQIDLADAFILHEQAQAAGVGRWVVGIEFHRVPQ